MARRFSPKAQETVHVTVRCNNKEFLFHLDQTFSSLVSWLNCLPLFFQVSIHHVLFMSNHIHLLMTPSQDNIGDAMRYFLTNSAKYLNFFNGRVNHVFANRYTPTIIQNERHLVNVVRYIYQNPVRAQLTHDCVAYPYSSLGSYLGSDKKGIFLEPDLFTKQLFRFGLEGRGSWLGHIRRTLSESDALAMDKSFSRKKFKFSREQLTYLSKASTSLVL